MLLGQKDEDNDSQKCSSHVPQWLLQLNKQKEGELLFDVKSDDHDTNTACKKRSGMFTRVTGQVKQKQVWHQKARGM